MTMTTGNEEPIETELDVSRAPLGLRAARQLVEAVAKLDDRAERHYLELKSSLGEGKTGIAKIAKFILGAANRMPETAAAAFEGYAVMIIGIADGDILGVPPIEIKDIEEIVVRYIGPSGPRWDLIHVPVADSDNSVLVVTVEPPEDGQELFPCRKDGDNLYNGRIYIRADGQTREARADEIDLLLERGRRSLDITPSFDVQIVGDVHRIGYDADQTVEAYLRNKTRVLLRALPLPEPEPEPESQPEPEIESGQDSSPRLSSLGESATANISRLASEAAGLAAGYVEIPGLRGAGEGAVSSYLKAMNSVKKPTTPSFLRTIAEERTEDDYRESIDAWEKEFRAAWPNAVDALAAWTYPSAAFQVTNKTKLFLHNVQLKVHLEGDVRGLDAIDYDGELPEYYLELPKAPRTWGPIEVNPLAGIANHTYVSGSDFVPSSYRSPLNWNNSGSVDLTLDIGELRPNGTYSFDEDEIVLVISSDEPGPVRGTWQITADGYHEIYSGRLEVQIVESKDMTGALRAYLRLN